MSAPNRSFAMPKFASTLEFRMLGLAVVLAVILSFISPHFFTERNMFNILDQSVVLGIVAVGMTLVILTGGIDLSVGSVAGLTGIILALLLKEFPIPVAIAMAVGCGALIGLFSGVLISVFGLAPFVVTLGVMAMGRSLAYIVSGQRSISGLPMGLQDIVYTTVLGIPTNVIFLIVLYIATWAWLTYSKGGRTIYAVGSNIEAARASGIPVKATLWSVYILAGLLVGLGGWMFLARFASGTSTAGNLMELEAIAAVVIGGAALSGGKGKVFGTVVGTIIFAVIANLLSLLNVSTFLQDAFRGALILVAVTLATVSFTRHRRKTTPTQPAAK